MRDRRTREMVLEVIKAATEMHITPKHSEEHKRAQRRCEKAKERLRMRCNLLDPESLW